MSSLSEIAARFPPGDPASLRPFLSAVQAAYNWIPPEALDLACDHFGVSYPKAYEEASLNPEFCTEPRGRHVVTICRGLACTEAQGPDVLADWSAALKLKDGETTPDGEFTLLTQHCFGRCAVGPNIKIDNNALSGQQPGMAVSHLKTFHYPKKPSN